MLIFFEWQDFEERLKENYRVKFPADSVYKTSKFDLADALGYESISIFVDSKISNSELTTLSMNGLKRIFLRCAGYNMLDVDFAKSQNIAVYRVASYSPESIAEFAMTLILSLARKITIQREKHKLLKNGRHLSEMGFCLHGKTIGLHGYGKIAQQLAAIAKNGFNMEIKYFDPFVQDIPGKVDSLESLYSSCDIVSIHIPLNENTRNIVDDSLLRLTKPGFMLINTSRGGIVVNSAIIKKLQSDFFYGTDVWGENDLFEQKLYLNNCIQTDHVAFFTNEAVLSILNQTLESYTGAAEPANIL